MSSSEKSVVRNRKWVSDLGSIQILNQPYVSWKLGTVPASIFGTIFAVRLAVGG
jgi:hypothetical protein